MESSSCKMSRLFGLLLVGSCRDLIAHSFSCFGKSDVAPDSSLRPSRPEGIDAWSIDGHQSFELPTTAAQTGRGLSATNSTRGPDIPASNSIERRTSTRLPSPPRRATEWGSKSQEASLKKKSEARSSVPDAKARAEAARGGWHSDANVGPSDPTAIQSTPSARRVRSGRNSEKRQGSS
jgi:hypothetical protein